MKVDQATNILITGATDGIGLLLAHLYLAQGANVVITGRRDAKAVEQVIPKDAIYIQANQEHPQITADLITKAMTEIGWDHCDLAILNAGNGHVCNPLQENPEAIRDTLNVNLVAPILIARTLVRFLDKAHHGKLVFIGSTSHKGAAKFASYAASKAGLHGFARSLREEWHHRITVLIIHPGPTATGMHAKAGFDAGAMKRLFFDPDYVARTIVASIHKGASPVSIGVFARIKQALSLRKNPVSAGDI